ncbi:hypothetical protein [Brevundimonas sp.]|uniref:hypothetical protein n=1 Tax=Brevundimonas sp. TaxID=1871086 RepID=UPI002737A039|nr:hypothetical protein [Brevundimonas sp.]MDP3803756.1 hypothetical protein [Brevundimonas sp.]
MKRVMLAVVSAVLLSCQGPAAVMAQETANPHAASTEAHRFIALADPEAFRRAISADLVALPDDKPLQVWTEPRGRDEVVAEGPPPTMAQMSVEEALEVALRLAGA